MLDRLAEHDNIRQMVKSKNIACDQMGCSKGTINAYRKQQKQASACGIDLKQVRHMRYRQLTRFLARVRRECTREGAGGSSGETASSERETLVASFMKEQV